MPDSSTRPIEKTVESREVPARRDFARFYGRVGNELDESAFRSVDLETGLRADDDETFWFDDTCREPLQAAGLTHFDAVMQSKQGQCTRALKVRENWRLPIKVGGRRRTFFLKKHHVRTWGSWLRALLGLPPRVSPGREEARNIRKLEAAGIPCMELAAFGERTGQDGLQESFLITPELEGFIQLDDFLRARFGILDTQRASSRDRDLRQLLDRVAAIARQFHEAGFNHRDLYCCHFFIREQRPGDFDIRLIDLQRVQYRKRRRRRWLVKDLAQLAYSAPRDRIKCTQKMAFIRKYFGVGKLRPEDKQLIREVLARQNAMERKLGLIA